MRDKKDYIDIGDTVRVDINGGQVTVLFRAKVLHLPQATGDSWVFRGQTHTGNNDLVYISEGITITKLKE